MRARNRAVPSELMQALYSRRHDDVKRLLADEPDLDVFEAAALGKVPRLRNLVQADPTLTACWSEDGFTPLHLAAFFGQLASVRWLVDEGADVNAASRNDMGVQPLHSAAAAQSIDVCNLLLERGADPNARQASGDTPLGAARHSGNDELERLLREHGATE